MAGNPKRRAARQIVSSVAQGEPIPEALHEGAPVAPTRTRAPHAAPSARARTPAPASRSAGPVERGFADVTYTEEMRNLAEVLRPGVSVRIERLKPTWAAGWVCDLTLDTGSMSELYQELADEWGGKLYRVQVLHSNGIPAFDMRIAVAGPPLECGRVLERSDYDPDAAPPVRTAQAAPVAVQGSSDLGGILQVFNMLMDAQQRATDAQMTAMRELSERSAAQNQTLIDSMLQVRTAEARGGSLAGQLTDLMEANRAIEKVKRTFGAAAPTEGDENPDEPIQGAMKEAAAHFFKNVIASEFIGPKRPAAPPQRRPPSPMAPASPPPRPQVVRPVAAPKRAANPRDIPEAV